MKLVNNADEQFKQWQITHNHFFHKDMVIESLYNDAMKSLLNYWRIHNLDPTSAHLKEKSLSIRWEHIINTISIILGFGFGLFATMLEKSNEIGMIVLALGLILVGRWAIIEEFIKSRINASVFTEFNFCKHALEKYRELYGNELGNDTKLIEKNGGVLIEVPLNIEHVYEEKMNHSQYYEHVYLVTVLNGTQRFSYLWYSNIEYDIKTDGTRELFFQSCEKQVGKNWRDNYSEFWMNELEYILSE